MPSHPFYLTVLDCDWYGTRLRARRSDTHIHHLVKKCKPCILLYKHYKLCLSFLGLSPDAGNRRVCELFATVSWPDLDTCLCRTWKSCCEEWAAPGILWASLCLAKSCWKMETRRRQKTISWSLYSECRQKAALALHNVKIGLTEEIAYFNPKVQMPLGQRAPWKKKKNICIFLNSVLCIFFIFLNIYVLQLVYDAEMKSFNSRQALWIACEMF